MKYSIAIIGTGYVGLVAGTCFAEVGNQVICVDKDREKINRLKAGIIPIYEPGLGELIERNHKNKQLQFTTEISKAITSSEVIFIAVGTPENEDGSADLSHVLKVAEEIAESIDGYKVIVNKSTVPVGTGEKVKAIIEKKYSSFDMVSNPEFLKEGSAIKDFLKPDRVVVGAENEKAFKIMEDLYYPFLINKHPLIKMDVKSAELTKYACNAMLATKISFINEIANLCDQIGADISKVRQGMQTDVRIGYHFLYPGIGYGGSCFPKDVKAIIRTAGENSLDFSLLKSVDQINTQQKKIIVSKIINQFGEDLSGKIFGLWGLAFKPETDDVREAPSHTIIEEILSRGGKIRAHDPEAGENTRKVWEEIVFENPYQTLENADALILCTEWMTYRQADFSFMAEKMKTPIIFDGRNLWSSVIRDFPFDWHGIGIPSILNYSNSKS